MGGKQDHLDLEAYLVEMDLVAYLDFKVYPEGKVEWAHLALMVQRESLDAQDCLALMDVMLNFLQLQDPKDFSLQHIPKPLKLHCAQRERCSCGKATHCFTFMAMATPMAKILDNLAVACKDFQQC